MKRKTAEVIFLLIFAAFIFTCSIGNFGNKEPLLGAVNLTLAILAIFYAGRISAR